MQLQNPCRTLPVSQIQGELVDRVEYHVGKAEVDVGEARVELKKAEGYQRKARKVGNADGERIT